MNLETLQRIIAKILNVDAAEVLLETTFREDLGADSLDFYQILVEVEKAEGITLNKKRLELARTVQDLLDLLDMM